MNRFNWFVALMFCLNLTIGEATTSDDIITQIQSPELKVRRNALRLAETETSVANCNEIVTTVCAILPVVERDVEFEGSLHTAIMVVGELKSEAGIPCLLKYLTFVPNGYRIEERIPTEMYFPVAVSLLKIGEPSIKYMKEILESNQSDDVSKKLAIWLIDQLEGQGKALEFIRTMTEPEASAYNQVLYTATVSQGATFEHPDELSGWERNGKTQVRFFGTGF